MLEYRRLLAVLTVTTTIDELDGGTLANHNGPDGKLSLREAINLANLSPGPDTVVLGNGTYKITIPGVGENANQTGDFDVLDNLTIQAAPGTHPVIDGNGLDRVFNIPAGHNGISLTLIGVTVTGGIAESSSADAGNGGGIDAESSGNKLTLINTTMTNNISTSPGSGIGGGIYNLNGDITLIGSHVDGNSAAAGVNGQAGGIYLGIGTGVLTLTNSTVNNNSAYNIGGGIVDLSSSPFQATGSQINNNHAGEFAGAEVESQNITVTNSSVSGNTSGADGGGLAVVTGSTSHFVTITNGTFSNNSATGDGGALDADGAQVVISGSTFSGNSAGGNGGAIVGTSGVSATDSSFTNNKALTGFGGAIDQTIAGSISILRSTFTGNAAPNSGNNAEGGAIFAASSSGPMLIDVNTSNFKQNSAAADGGAIYANGDTVHVTKSTFDHNSGTQGEGGAIDDASGGIVVTDSSFTNNTAKADGGGFNADGGDVTVTRGIITGNVVTNGVGGGFADGQTGTGVVSVIDTTISGNTAGGNGGGFTADGLRLVMTGSTVSGNRSGSQGGGIYIATTGVFTSVFDYANGSVLVNDTIGANGARIFGGGIDFEGNGDLGIGNVTIAYNASTSGGGIAQTAGTGTIHIVNTIDALNTATNGPDAFSGVGAFDDLGHNLIFSTIGSSGFTGPGDIFGVDPHLGPLANNGGLTQTYALLAGSPAIDTADDTFAPLTDQRGVTRPQGAHADIGAYEYQAPAATKKGGSSGGGGGGGGIWGKKW
jgi:predicted outer membrane repeat protein